jgi:glycosyltransferase involved in cell wall biosynthesis
MDLRVTVVIPHYNYSRYLPDAVKSVINESYVEEVVIVDDDSRMEERSVVRHLGEHPKIAVDWQERNEGVAACRNDGVSGCKTSLITFLDADDMRVPGAIAKQVEYFQVHPTVEIVWGLALEIRGDVSYEWASKRQRSLRVHPSEVNPQTVMYRREVFEKWGGFYEPLRSKEDKLLHMKLGIHPDSPFKNRTEFKKLKEPMAFYRKHPQEKHKLRKADKKWAAETDRIFKARMKELKRDAK